MTTIWHNPRCSKSRETLRLLEETGISPTVRPYLEDPPSREEIEDALRRLDLPASKLVRVKEAEFRALQLKTADEETLISAMVSHPRLIERPIVFHGGKAAIGRPPEAVLALFS